MTRRLVARLDNLGDVVLTGPAVRAVAAAGHPVTFLAGPSGSAAARLLPGVDAVLEFDAPWVPFECGQAERSAIDAFVDTIAAAAIDEAVILTSFHQSPLPLALLLRLAGVGRIAATSVDYPGSLLDTRHPYVPSLHEVEQSLSLCAAAGFDLPADDDGSLRLTLDEPSAVAHELTSGRPYVVVHPGASVPARRLPCEETAALIAALTARDVHVVVTGTMADRARAEHLAALGVVSRTHVVAGSTDVAGLAAVLAGATAAVCGNTGAMHLAAAVGTPVVVAFAPVVPAHRWRPWKVEHALLGALDIDCAGCRSRRCPIPGQPCLQPFTASAALAALAELGSLHRIRVPSAVAS
jgi:ADP-heptose:LPS heptosyltransferase